MANGAAEAVVKMAKNMMIKFHKLDKTTILGF